MKHMLIVGPVLILEVNSDTLSTYLTRQLVKSLKLVQTMFFSMPEN